MFDYEENFQNFVILYKYTRSAEAMGHKVFKDASPLLLFNSTLTYFTNWFRLTDKYRHMKMYLN